MQTLCKTCRISSQQFARYRLLNATAMNLKRLHERTSETDIAASGGEHIMSDLKC